MWYELLLSHRSVKGVKECTPVSCVTLDASRETEVILQRLGRVTVCSRYGRGRSRSKQFLPGVGAKCLGTIRNSLSALLVRPKSFQTFVCKIWWKPILKMAERRGDTGHNKIVLVTSQGGNEQY
jgi:hypothetical protein